MKLYDKLLKLTVVIKLTSALLTCDFKRVLRFPVLQFLRFRGIFGGKSFLFQNEIGRKVIKREIVPRTCLVTLATIRDFDRFFRWLQFRPIGAQPFSENPPKGGKFENSASTRGKLNRLR